MEENRKYLDDTGTWTSAFIPEYSEEEEEEYDSMLEEHGEDKILTK